MLVHLPNLSIFNLIDSENENMLFKNYFRFQLMTILDIGNISITHNILRWLHIHIC